MVHEMRARVFPNGVYVCVAYVSVISERASVSVAARRACAALRSTRHHGPLSNQLGSPGKPEAANTSLYAETKNVFIEI